MKKLLILSAIMLTLTLPLSGCGYDKLPPGTIPWYEARDHDTETVTVCGLISGAKTETVTLRGPITGAEDASTTTYKRIFLTMGKGYADLHQHCFRIVIWDSSFANFPQPLEEYYLGKVVCVSGMVIWVGRDPRIEAFAVLHQGAIEGFEGRHFLGYTDCETEQVLVVRVIDGDTIELEDGRIFHYLDIDAPELGEPYGVEALARNRELVEGKLVVIEGGGCDIDKYYRPLRYVYVEGIFVNAELVEQGYARACISEPDEIYSQVMVRLEQYAKMKGRGLWSR